jgi:origin recognition complex subunit 1
MELRHPSDAYVKFWEAVSGTRKERLPAGDAANELEHYFCGDQFEESGEYEDDDYEQVDVSEKPVTVLMLDEIDYLVTKKETIFYNFFDWPLRATTARLVVIGISNTLTLPEKMSPRVQSRIGGNRCYFQAYNVHDTITILKTRLGMLGDTAGYSVFDEDAIKFAARKTANLSGDIRKAFHMCKVAAEIVYEDYNRGKRQLTNGSRPVVKISDVQKGSRDMFTSIVHKAVSCSTSYEALLLISLGALKRTRDDDGMFTVKEILMKVESVANSSGEARYMNARLSFADVLGMINRLGGAGIIQLNTYASSPWPWVSTHLHTYEILGSYRDTRHSKLAEKHLADQRLF